MAFAVGGVLIPVNSLAVPKLMFCGSSTCEVVRDELREWERLRTGVLGRAMFVVFMLVDGTSAMACDCVCFGSFEVIQG
jgi:hypothetical protein